MSYKVFLPERIGLDTATRWMKYAIKKEFTKMIIVYVDNHFCPLPMILSNEDETKGISGAALLEYKVIGVLEVEDLKNFFKL